MNNCRNLRAGIKLTNSQKLDLIIGFKNTWEAIEPVVKSNTRPYHKETMFLKQLIDDIKNFDVFFVPIKRELVGG